MSQKLITLFAIVLLIVAGLGCSMLRPKRATWSVTLEVVAASPDREALARQTVTILESRLNALGVTNSTVKVQGEPANGRIVINLPEVADRERLKNLMTTRGQLELAHVVTPPSPAPMQTYNTREEAISSLGGTIPAKRRVLPYAETAAPPRPDPQSQLMPNRWVVIETPAIIDGSSLRNAEAVPERVGEDYQIAFSLKVDGAEKFGKWTEANINEYVAVVLNDEVKSIAFIKSRISDVGEIRGQFTRQSATDLALILKSGALPAPVNIVEEAAGR